MKNLQPFHLAIPVDKLEICKEFYENTLQCLPGRSSETWADYNFFGHQLVLHCDPTKKKLHHNKVDGKSLNNKELISLKVSDFEKIAEAIIKRNENRPYPDINNLPN